ncbi:MAG: SDR family NAD(P)-dependent oxidoreductase [Pseudomonadota bacterium]
MMVNDIKKLTQNTKKILVTGVAGFIGSHVAKRLCELGVEVVGIDNLNDYYDVRLKEWRLENFLSKFNNFKFIKLDIEDKDALERIFSEHKFDAVINLAARAGVRASLDNPQVYITTNMLGTANLLGLCKKHDVKKFVLASTSSLYAGKEMPFDESIPTTTPISPYAASKGGAEGIAYSYHYLYDIDVSILRYFTVYGPAGRPDMSIFRFIKWAFEGNHIQLMGDGTQKRDFTYVDDIADGTIKALKNVGYEIFNLGGDAPHELVEMISFIEGATGAKLKIDRLPFPKEDMKATWASIEKSKKMLDWSPKVSFIDGLKKTVDWTRENWEFVKELNI